MVRPPGYRPHWQIKFYLFSIMGKLSIFSAVLCRQREHAGSKTLHQQNPPVLNWRCRLTHADLYNGRKTRVGCWWSFANRQSFLDSNHAVLLPYINCCVLFVSYFLLYYPTQFVSLLFIRVNCIQLPLVGKERVFRHFVDKTCY